MTKWLINTKRPSLKRSSYDRVEQSLNYQIFPAIGKIKLKKLTADDIQMMLTIFQNVLLIVQLRKHTLI